MINTHVKTLHAIGECGPACPVCEAERRVVEAAIQYRTVLRGRPDAMVAAHLILMDSVAMLVRERGEKP